MTSKAEQKPLPYHKEIHQYFLCLTKFLDITTFENNNPNNENNTNDGSNSLRSQKARAKLLKLSPLQFYELCTDVTDELNRRIRESGYKSGNNTTTAISNSNQDDKSKSYLLPEPNYHLKRNQARQKLSHLSQLRFSDLLGDILFELRRRGYHIVDFDNESILDSKMSSPEVIDSKDIDISKKMTNDNTENAVLYDTGNTNDLNASAPLPSMIQSSLVIPQKASIDWSEEDEETGEEEEEDKNDESNTYNYKIQMIDQRKDEVLQSEMELAPEYLNEGRSHLADNSEIEYVDITEDFIQHDLMNNPFDVSSKDLNNATLEDAVIKIPSSKSHDENTNNSNAKSSISASSEFEPKRETSIDFEEQRQRHSIDITSSQLSTDVLEKNSESNNDDRLLNGSYEDVTITEPLLKRDKNGELSEELSKQSSDIFSSSKEQSTVPTLLQSPGSVSHLQNELVSLNKQFTALSIENERLKTKILELEVINSGHYNMNNNSNNKVNSSKSQDQADITKDNNTLHSLTHENIAQFIKEYGVIPETLIIQLYNVVNDLYSHISNTRRSDMNLTNSSSNINFGKTLFQLVDQFYEIILKIIDLLSQSEEKDKIVLLKSTFSNLITTSKYFALYHHILPDIVIISSINECIFVIIDIINILKVKEDPLIVEKNSSRKLDMPNFKPNVGSIGIPLTPPPNVISSNNSTEVSSLDGSPVKPLKIIEKVASSPLINRNNGEEFRRASGALRKPSNNVLISLTSLVQKHSNEKLITSKEEKDTKSNESISNISSNTFYKRSTSSLIKRMSFSSYPAGSSSESENNDDTDDTDDLLQNLRKQKEEVNTQFQGASSLDKKTSINLLPSSNNTLKLNASDSTSVVGIVDRNRNVLKEEFSGQEPIETGELMESLNRQGIVHKPKSSKELAEQEVVDRRGPEQVLAHKLELQRKISENESVEGKEFQEEIANKSLTEVKNLGVVSMEQESVERHDFMDDLTGHELLNNRSSNKKLDLQESFERCNLDENLLKDESSYISKPNAEVSEEELVERDKFRQDLPDQGFPHVPQSREELSQKALHIRSTAVSSETNIHSGISLNGKFDKQFSQPNIKTKYQLNPMSSHDIDLASDKISYSITNNKVLSDTDKQPQKCGSSKEVISSPFLHNDSVKSTDIKGTSGNIMQNNNFGKLNIEVTNEESSTENVLSSPQVTDIKPNKDTKILHIKERPDRMDKHIIPEKKASPSSKVENTISSPNLNTSSSMKSIDSPIVKPFKIMKFESRSLKKINLLSKDTKNENTPGLGIIIDENDTSSTKGSEINRVDADSLELPDDKEMKPINKSEQCGPSENTSARLSSSSILIDQKEKEVVTDKTPRRPEADDFDMLDDENSNMRIQKGGNLKMFTSATINEECVDETHSDESSVSIDSLELLNQESLKKKSIMEADDTQCNGDNSNVNSYKSHDSLDLNQTKDERELSNLKETTVIPGFKRNIDISENINEHMTVNREEKLGHIPDISIRYEENVNNGVTIDDESFQFIQLQSKNINDVSKNSYIQHNFDDKKGEQLSISKPIETKMVNMAPEAIGGDSEIDSEVENSTEGSESETETETSSATSSDSGSEFESDSNVSEELDNGEEEEEEEEDFDVEAFDIENPDNTLSELLLYLEHQTVQVITTIQSLLASIKEPRSTKGNLRNESNEINQVIKQMVDATSISMNQSRNASLKEHGSWVVQSLKDCSHRMITLCQLSPDDKFKVMDNDTDYADKNFKQRLAGISFDIAKCTKELVKSVEEASLKEEIEYLNSKIHKK